MRRLLALATIALLAGCASRPAPQSIVLAPVATAPRPERPADLPETLRVPPRGGDGRYATINRALTPAGTVWHVRSALNVAALGCRGPEEVATIAGYNRLLATRKALLAAADRDFRGEFRRVAPTAWQSLHDGHNTRVYNFFAQPLDYRRFCATAGAVLAEAETIPDAAFPTFAAAALDRLEAPFTDAYARHDAYRIALATWEVSNGTRVARLEVDASVYDWDGGATGTPVTRMALGVAGSLPD